MSRVSDLEKKVDALERNVGMLAKEACLDDCLMISDCSSIRKYRDGIECECTPVKNDKGEACAFSKEEVKELENSRKQLDDIISDAKFENSLKLIELINIGIKKIGVEVKIVVNPFNNSATIYHTYGNNKGIDGEKPKCTIPLYDKQEGE